MTNKISFSRRAFAPELCQATVTPLSELVTTALDAVVHAELQQANAGGSIRKRDFCMDCLETSEAMSFFDQLCPAMTNGKEQKKKYRRRNADRRN